MGSGVATAIKVLLVAGLIAGLGFGVTGMVTGKLSAISGGIQSIKAYAPNNTALYNKYNLTLTPDANSGIPVSAQ